MLILENRTLGYCTRRSCHPSLHAGVRLMRLLSGLHLRCRRAFARTTSCARMVSKLNLNLCRTPSPSLFTAHTVAQDQPVRQDPRHARSGCHARRNFPLQGSRTCPCNPSATRRHDRQHVQPAAMTDNTVAHFCSYRVHGEATPGAR